MLEIKNLKMGNPSPNAKMENCVILSIDPLESGNPKSCLIAMKGAEAYLLAETISSKLLGIELEDVQKSQDYDFETLGQNSVIQVADGGLAKIEHITRTYYQGNIYYFNNSSVEEIVQSVVWNHQGEELSSAENYNFDRVILRSNYRG